MSNFAYKLSSELEHKNIEPTDYLKIDNDTYFLYEYHEDIFLEKSHKREIETKKLALIIRGYFKGLNHIHKKGKYIGKFEKNNFTIDT